jgi:hypothetical protein
MTERAWLCSGNPTPMLNYVWNKVSTRVVRLFACACGRRAWHLMTDERSRCAIELNERLAEGGAKEEERPGCWQSANAASCQARRMLAYPEEAAVQALATAAEAAELILSPLEASSLLCCGIHAAAAALAYEAAALTKPLPTRPWPETFTHEDEEAMAWVTRYQEFQKRECFLQPYQAERHVQADLLRDVIGNRLFHSTTLEPDHRTPTIISLAQAAYEERTLPSGELDPVRLSVLADALEEIGAEEALIRHCRGYRWCLRCGGTGRSPYDLGYYPPPLETCPDCGGTGWVKSILLHVCGCFAVDACIGLS